VKIVKNKKQKQKNSTKKTKRQIDDDWHLQGALFKRCTRGRVTTLSHHHEPSVNINVIVCETNKQKNNVHNNIIVVVVVLYTRK